MGKLMKYEIKGSSRFILGVLLLVVILTSGIYLYMGRAIETDGSALGALFVGLSFMVIFGTMIGTFFYIVNSFRKELYEDRGYLTFTLPLSGKEILGAKLLVAMFWFILLGVSIAIVNIIGMRYLVPSDMWSQIPTFGEIISSMKFSEVLITLIMFLFTMITPLLTIYLSMALGRITLKNRKLSGIWFIIFLVITLIVGIGQSAATELIPYYLNINNPAIESRESLISSTEGKVGSRELAETYLFGYDDSSSYVLTRNFEGDTLISIGASIYMVVILVVIFLWTSRLIEKKIDL